MDILSSRMNFKIQLGCNNGYFPNEIFSLSCQEILVYSTIQYMSIIKKHITAKSISEIIGIPIQSVRNSLCKLKKFGALEVKNKLAIFYSFKDKGVALSAKEIQVTHKGCFAPISIVGDKNLSGSEKKVIFMMIALLRNVKSRNIDMRWLSKKLCVGRHAIGRALRRLVDFRYLERMKLTKMGSYQYRLTNKFEEVNKKIFGGNMFKEDVEKENHTHNDPRNHTRGVPQRNDKEINITSNGNSTNNNHPENDHHVDKNNYLFFLEEEVAKINRAKDKLEDESKRHLEKIKTLDK